MRRMCIRLWLAALLLAVNNASADPMDVINTDPTKLIGKKIIIITLDAADVRLLEPACVVPLTNGTPGKLWYHMVRDNPILNDPRYYILKDAISLHHFCRGQAAKIRYFKERDPVLKKRLLHEHMIGENVFMISHPEWLPKNWPYMKRMHLELGMARVLAKQNGEAVRSFEEALRLDPAYEEAHIAYADALISMGLKDKALAQVTEGLKHNPDTKALQRRYTKLGGKPPFPEPYRQATKPEVVTPVVAAPSGEHVQPAETVVESTPLAKQPMSETRATEAPATRTSPPPETVLPPGGANQNRDNPYCRFCP